MALYTVSITDGTTLSSLSVSAGRGPKGDGWTAVTYDNNTGRFTFTSNDGLGYVSDSITGDLDTAVTEAEAAQAAAEAAQAATENIFDQFGDQYLGPKASDPTVDNDGDPLTEGDIYFNTTDDVLKFYSGSAWVAPESIATTAATAAQAAQAAAETAETNAETAQTNAETAETNAANSASAAATSYDSFDDRYLGAKATAPTVDNDGDPLITGALYFDTTSDAMQVYTGSAWVTGYVDVANYLALSGGTMTGDVAYGDNVKATFGASADLQIYHDGSNSFIKDTGSGNLRIDATNLQLRNGIGTETYANFTQDGGAELYYDNSKKLETTSTGIDVTGTVVADGLTVDNNNDIQINRDGVNSAKVFWNRGGTQDAAIELAANEHLNFDNNFGNPLNFRTGAVGSEVQHMRIAPTGDISFYEDTGTTPKFFWDASAERLGIGTSSPEYTLDFGVAASGNVIRVGGQNQDAYMSFSNPRGSVGYSYAQNSMAIQGGATKSIAFNVSGSTFGSGEAARFDTSGNFTMTGGGSVGWANFTFVEESGYLYVYNGSTKIMRVDASGNAAFAGDVEANATL